jgi:hypothetical protein
MSAHAMGLIAVGLCVAHTFKNKIEREKKQILMKKLTFHITVITFPV